MQQAENNPDPSSIRRLLAFLLLIASGATIGWVFGYTGWNALITGAAGLLSAPAGSWSFPWLTFFNFLSAGVTLFLIFGVGCMIVHLPACRNCFPLLLERLVFAMLAGGAITSTIILIGGLIRIDPFMFGAIYLGLGLAAIGGCMRFFQDLKPLSPILPRRPTASLCLILFLAPIAVVSLFYAAAPAVESDELRYHLSALFIWKGDQRIHYIPHQAFSNFPMLGEMLFLAVPGLTPLRTGAAKLIHLGYLPVAMGLISLIARLLIRSGGRRPPTLMLVAAAAFAFIPSVPILAAWGFVDMFMVSYFLGFVYIAGRFLSRPGRDWSLPLGIVIAGALATKYSMLPLLAILGFFWLLLVLPNSAARARLPRLLIKSAPFILCIGGIWYLRNFIWTGNPFYPLAWSVFHGGDWSDANAAFYAQKAAEKGFLSAARLAGTAPEWAQGPLGHFFEFLITPWTTTFHFGRFESNPLGLVPLLFLALALGGHLLPSPIRRFPGTPLVMFRAWIVLCATLSWAFWFVTYQSNRLLLPTIALVIALGVSTLPRWRSAFPRVMAVIHLLIGACFLFGFLLWLYILGSRDPGAYLAKSDAVAVSLGFQSPELYLRRNLDYYPAAEWLNEYNAANPGKALLIGEHRTLYFDLPVMASDWFDTPQPLPWIRATFDNDVMLDAMFDAGIRYIFYNRHLLDRYRDLYFSSRFTMEEYARFNALWENSRLELLRQFQIPGRQDVVIYAIRPQSSR